MTNELGGVGLDYINFSPTENKSQIYVRHYLPHSNQPTASNHTDNHTPSFDAYDPETPRGLNGYQTTATDCLGVGYFGQISPGHIAGHAVIYFGNTYFDGQNRGKDFHVL